MARPHKVLHKYRHVGTEFGQRIMLLRKQRGMTQRQLATELEMSAAMVCQIENGHRPNVNLTHIWAFANALQVSPAELLVPSAFTVSPTQQNPLAARIATLVQREVDAYLAKDKPA